MASHRMSTIVRVAAVCAVAALGSVWAGGPGPARAQDEHEGAERAREECRELLREHGFEDIDLGDGRRHDDGRTIVFEVEAEHEGEEHEIRCVFDREDEEAQLDD